MRALLWSLHPPTYIGLGLSLLLVSVFLPLSLPLGLTHLHTCPASASYPGLARLQPNVDPSRLPEGSEMVRLQQMAKEQRLKVSRASLCQAEASPFPRAGP